VAPPAAEPNKSAALLALALRSLAARTLTAITNAFTLILVGSVWALLSQVLWNGGEPTNKQLIALAGYATFCLLIDIVRRKK
jgi:hypothetical protein